MATGCGSGTGGGATIGGSDGSVTVSPVAGSATGGLTTPTAQPIGMSKDSNGSGTTLDWPTFDWATLDWAAAASSVSWSYGSFVEQLKEAATAQRPK